ncbi:MAG: ABC transporter permease [Chloroflexota bacterium]
MAQNVNADRQTQWRASSALGRLANLLSRTLKTRGAGFGLAVLGIMVLVAIIADVLAPYNPNLPQAAGALQLPSTTHWLGTDQLGRDVLSRLMFGARVALLAGLLAVGIAIAVGTLTGLIAGYRGGWLDDLLMRLMDTLWSFPTLVLALAIAASLGPGLTNSMIAIGVVFTPAFARLTRGKVLTVRELDYVTAAQVVGAKDARILALYILPNVAAPIIVEASLMIGTAIIYEASLSFLGLGIEPPQASWGSMLREAYQYMDRAPWLSLFPGMAIFLAVLAANFLGDALQTAMDPTLRERE